MNRPEASAVPDTAMIPGVRRDEPMSHHTSWRVGGPADVYFRPRDRAGLCEFLAGLNADTPVCWIGLGSNLLVRDGGIRGVVIATGDALGGLRRLDEGLVEAEAGVACTSLARQCGRWRLGPAEFFAGIPGTIGGALTLNAGAFGAETWDRVVDVDTIGRDGQTRLRRREEFDVGYRQVNGPAGEWFVAARFQLEPQRPGAQSRSRELMRERRRRQPLGLPSCGSVFRNPPGRHAAELIETAGLKGQRIGGAQVSEKHANFIINTGSATAADIENLIDHVRRVTARVHGIELVPEVHIVGEAAGERGQRE